MPHLPLPSLEVIRAGSSYLKAALLIEQSNDTQLYRPACVLSGLAIELFIKSFLAKDDSTLITTFNGIDMYSSAVAAEHGHFLDKLFDKIEPSMRQAILDTSERLYPGYPLEQKLKDYAGYFHKGRYDYESGSLGIMRMEVLDTAEHMEQICTELIPKVVMASDL
ncbi:hypothetical protein PFLUOLIPICF7_01720 [Pseudomonas simiae]|uniref:hypothetical protein n=1 Tax=Pseudomonas simiae TaxID=321846 RepID=UPI0005D82DB5|nr:hypothetical protein [Pseudomonas simiae]AJZ96906.1 hypothetical protein PFLUOLIPICF7_01720 [Pseudomonas simiae]